MIKLRASKDKERRENYKIHQPLKLKAQNLRNNMRSRSSKKVPTAAEFEAWLEAQEFVCSYTGVNLSKHDFSVDHKIPIDRGGSNQLDNLCICSPTANNEKGTMTDVEYRSLLALVATWDDGGLGLLGRLRFGGKAFRR